MMPAPVLKWYGNFALTGLQRDIDRRIKNGAKILEQAIKSEAPVDTGFLRDSVHSFTLTTVSRGDKQAQVAVTADAPYAGWVNYGTSRQAPNPFFQRGINKSMGKVRDAILDRGRITPYRIGTAIGRIFGLQR